MIGHDKLNLMRQRLFIPVTEFQGLVGAAGVGTGVPVHEEIGTLLPGIGALEMAASNDEIAHLMLIPGDWDRTQPIKVRAIWSCQSTAPTTDSVQFTFTYVELTPDTTAISDPATALDTVIADDTVIGTINVLQRSAAGVINGGSLADAALYWAFKLAATLTAVTEKVYFHGVEFEYSPKLTPGAAHRSEAEAWEA